MGGTKKQHTQRKKRKVCSHLTDISLGFAGRGRNDFGALGQNFCLLIPEVDIGVQYQRRIAGEVTETFTGDVTLQVPMMKNNKKAAADVVYKLVRV